MKQEELKMILEEHSKWLFDKGKKADLRGANLHGANLCRANLCRANLRQSNLRQSSLHGASLHGADLHGASLRGANLRGADLRRADLHEANLYRASLRGANLRGADLRGADLRGADLRGADLRQSSLRGASLHGVDLRGASLGDLTSILLCEWGDVSDELCLDLMRLDCDATPNGKRLFDAWVDGGGCPYNECTVDRIANFQERRDLWKYGRPKSIVNIVDRLLGEKTKDWEGFKRRTE